MFDLPLASDEILSELAFIFRKLLSVLLLQLLMDVAAAQSQTSQPAQGSAFQKVQGKHIQLITDMPLSEELRELPQVFDAALATWCRIFDADPDAVKDWHCTACIMLDRSRFESAGLIPSEIPKFPHGFQYGDQIWVNEQPSAYYRRHLLLHEGTHWFMTRKYGNAGPPWLMEGMAEWLATHRWDAARDQLTMGIVPGDKQEVPFWGRITLIQDQLSGGLAPSLESIMRYSNTAHQQLDAYAWSWALVVFLKHHPRTENTFRALLRRPMQPDLTLSRWLFRKLRSQWPRMRQEWNAFLTEIDYGYDPAAGMLRFSDTPKPASETPVLVSIEAKRPWQPSGVFVRAGERLHIKASGEYVIAHEPGPWTCYPGGVTLEYYRGNPLGKLMMAVVAPLDEEPDFSTTIERYAIGGEFDLDIKQMGELHFRINEATADLADNTGQVQIKIFVDK